MPVMTKTPNGEEIVILARKEYDHLVEVASEDARDAAIAMKAIARGEEILTESELNELLAAKTPLAFWRKKRDMTQAELSASIDVAQGFISEIENGSKTGDVKTLAKIAKTLSLSIDDLIVEPVKAVPKQAGKKPLKQTAQQKTSGPAKSKQRRRSP